MRKQIILFSALVMSVAIATGCGSTTSTSSNPTSSQAESSSDTESQTEELIEIDPFEDINFTFHHDYDGKPIEKIESSNYYIDFAWDGVVYDEMTSIQSIYGIKAIDKCKELGCDIDVYREVLPDELKEGDTVTYKLLINGESVKESEIQSYVKEKYNINFTQISKEVTAHFEEETVLECDPFEGAEVKFISAPMDGGPDYIYPESNLEVLNNDEPFEGYQKALSHNCNITYELSSEKDLDALAEGDIIKYTVIWVDENGTRYEGENVNSALEGSWKKIHFTQTTKEYTVTLSNDNSETEE